MGILVDAPEPRQEIDHNGVLGHFAEWNLYDQPVHPTSFFGEGEALMVDGTISIATWRIPPADWYMWAGDRESSRGKQFVTNRLIRHGNLKLTPTRRRHHEWT
jgi:hypothetical protein